MARPYKKSYFLRTCPLTGGGVIRNDNRCIFSIEAVYKIWFFDERGGLDYTFKFVGLSAQYIFFLRPSLTPPTVLLGGVILED